MHKHLQSLSSIVIISVVFVLFGAFCAMTDAHMNDAFAAVFAGDCISSSSGQSSNSFCIFSFASKTIFSNHGSAFLSELNAMIHALLMVIILFLVLDTLRMKIAHHRCKIYFVCQQGVSRYLHYLFSQGILHPKLF